MNQQYRLFIGNPGVGKSTLINCLAQQFLFKSGIAIGAGMTAQLERKKHGGIVYMDTPGLADVKLRKAAAEAITEALKQNGIYQIFFVVTLESGRVRPQDLATIKIVLEHAKDVTKYSIIVNKLTKPVFDRLLGNEGQKFKELVAELNYGSGTNAEPPAILLLLREEILEDDDGRYTSIEDLNVFVRDAPCINVFPDHVQDIPSDDSFDRINSRIETELCHLRQDNELMRVRLEETERRYREIKNDDKVKILNCQFTLFCFSNQKYRTQCMK